jgi:bacillithiol disulfide reductase
MPHESSGPKTVDSLIWDVLVVGAGPTGLAVGAEARQAGLSVVLIDKGPITASLLGFPTFMRFFTTRDRLEIGGVPFTVPDEKPDRRQALVYYRAVVDHHDLTVRTHEEVVTAERRDDIFAVRTTGPAGETIHRARCVVVATGYFGHPRRLGVPGENQPWVRGRYLEPYEHFGERVALIGAGNSACEAALELWRSGAHVTLVHRGGEIKPTVKYWVKPDIENRIEEGSIAALFDATVTAFEDRAIVLRQRGEELRLEVAAAYVLIGYAPDAGLLRSCGVEVSEDELIPRFDEATGETHVPGLYIAGAVRSGVHTNHIFIDNSRDHGAAIVRHIAARLARS